MKALVAVLAVSPDVFRAPRAVEKNALERRREPVLGAVRLFAQAMALRPGVRAAFAAGKA